MVLTVFGSLGRTAWAAALGCVLVVACGEGGSADGMSADATGGVGGDDASAGAGGTSGSAGSAGFSGPGGGSGGASAGGSAAGSAGSPPQFEPPPERQIDAATLAQIAATMDELLGNAAIEGHTFGGYVVDADAGTVIYAENPDAALIPASNTKALTTAAALMLLGEDHRMLTRAFGDGAMGGDGTLDGDLNLHCEHDFTWSRWFYDDPNFPLDQLADRLYRAGLRAVNGEVGVYGAYLYEGHHFGSYSPAEHRSRAEAEFVAALGRRGIDVFGGSTNYGTMTLPPGDELARWESMPLSVALWPINRKSHNEMADILSRHIGYVIDDSSDYATGAAAVLGWLASTGVDTTGAELYDGSGLNTRNRLSARQLAKIYEHMLHQPAGLAWRRSLSVGGGEGPESTDGSGVALVTQNSAPYNGTLAFRMTGDDTAGRVFGKSGTNQGITTTGALYNRYDGRRYVFAFEMNDISSDAYSAARSVQDALVAAFAGDNLGGDPRPADPTLQFVGETNAGLVVEWEPVPGIAGTETVDGYYVYSSDDAKRWERGDRVYTLEPTYSPPQIAAGTTRYYRVTAVSKAGESDPSDVYAVGVNDSAERVLLVDANDRWQAAPTNENLMGAAHAFVERYASALTGVAFDTCSNEAVGEGRVALGGYAAVIWATGEESTVDESFDATEQLAINEYLAGGGKLFASGAEIGWDLDSAGSGQATAADAAFYGTKLRAALDADDSGAFSVRGAAGGIFEDTLLASFWSPGEMFVAFPDALAPVDGAQACLSYDGGNGVAALQYDGNFQVVYFGFPFESINDGDARREVMQGVMAFFGIVD